MAISKAKNSENPKNIDQLKSEVASFASSIGLSQSTPSSLPNTGFDDSDFRKSGPIKPSKPPKSKPSADKNPISHTQKFGKTKKNDRSRVRVAPSQPLDHRNGIHQVSVVEGTSKGKDLPKLPLMKASLLSGEWYVDATELESKVLGNGEGKRIEVKDKEDAKNLALKKKVVGERLLEQYSRDYETSRGRSGDIRMVSATQRSGTAADKVSAFAVMVEDNPMANLRSLDALLAMVTSKVGKRHALTGFDALKELFLRLLPGRKLKSLLQRPLFLLPESKDGFSLLLFWYWEECLKLRYERFIIALEDASKDMLPILKDKALKTIYTLLRSKSEQERRLLSALVNKLGDPERKAASCAGYYLSCLLSAHPNMKAVVIDEVDSFLFRPHLGSRAKYHAVNFLSQILLSKKGDGPKVAKRLVDVYFALFKVLISEEGAGKKNEMNSKKDDKKVDISQNSKGESPGEPNVEMDSRLLSSLLTGVNRAFPYVASDEADDIVEVQTPILFKLVHSNNFNVGVQALMLLYQISSKNQIASDRFYRALYAKLMIPVVMNSSKPEMFLGLLFKAMKADVNLKRVSAFSKRLLQVALQQPPQYACGCLFILSEVLKARPLLWNTVLQNETADEDDEHFEDIIEHVENVTDSAPSSKSETSISVTNISNGVQTDDDSSDIEDGVDLSVSYSEDDNSSDGEENLLGGDGSTDVEIFETVSDTAQEQAQVSNEISSLPGGYNPRHREPSYCNADRTSWWELTILASHVHPSVATMARTLLSGVNIVYNGDPLNDLSLGAFLDKFMEKKPKPNRRAEGMWHGGSQIAPARKLDMGNHLIGEEILSLAEEDVPPEDLVFHKFYMNKTSSSKKSKKRKKQAEDEAAAEELLGVDGSDENDSEEIDDMLGSGHLPLENDGDYDYDDLDKVVDEVDDDLIGGDSDGDVDSLSEVSGGDFDDHDSGDDGGAAVEDDDNVDFGDADDILDNEDIDGDDDDNKFSGDRRKNKKRKFGGRTRASPFAKLEDYDHLLHEEGESARKKPKSRNKKCSG